MKLTCLQGATVHNGVPRHSTAYSPLPAAGAYGASLHFTFFSSESCHYRHYARPINAPPPSAAQLTNSVQCSLGSTTFRLAKRHPIEQGQLACSSPRTLSILGVQWYNEALTGHINGAFGTAH